MSASARKFKAVIKSFPPDLWPDISDALVCGCFEQFVAEATPVCAGASQLLLQVKLRMSSLSLDRVREFESVPRAVIEGLSADVFDASHADYRQPRASSPEIRKALRKHIKSDNLKFIGSGPLLTKEVGSQGRRFRLTIDLDSRGQVSVFAYHIGDPGDAVRWDFRIASMLGYCISGWDEIYPEDIEEAVPEILAEAQLIERLLTG